MKRLPSWPLICCLAVLAPTVTAAQGLNIIFTICDVDLPTCTNGIQGLRGARQLAMSPDGEHVYVPVALDDALAGFALLADGTLDPVQTLFDTDSGIDGLDSARGAAVSPDGAHVYVAALVDSSLAAFSRDGFTGELTPVEVEFDGVGGVDGLAGAHAVAVSPDGEHVYVASRSDDAVAVFERTIADGSVTFLEAEFDNQAGVDGLDAAEAIVVSPDGAHVYVAGEGDNAVVAFERETNPGAPDFGELTFVEAEFDEVGGVDGLQGANGIAIDPAGDHVYVACERSSGGGDWISVFSRDAATGELDFVQSFDEEGLGLDYSNCSGVGPDNSAATVSPDGSAVYAVNPFRGTVVWFDRNAGDGTLTVNSWICDEGFGVDGIAGAAGVSTDPTGRRILTAAPSFETLAVLSQTIFADGFESGDTAAWSTTVP